MNNLSDYHGVDTQRRGAQCSCIGCIGLRPALVLESENNSHESEMVPATNTILTQRQVGC